MKIGDTVYRVNSDGEIIGTVTVVRIHARLVEVRDRGESYSISPKRLMALSDA